MGQRYIVTETGISMLINVIISALFMFIVFGRSALIGLWGTHGLALDFIPQTFMIAFMSIFVPTLLTRKRIDSGRLSAWPSTSSAFLSRSLVLRAVIMAFSLTLLLGGAAIVILSLIWTGPATYRHVFPYKLAYGAFVALIATPIGLRMALSEPRRTRE